MKFKIKFALSQKNDIMTLLNISNQLDMLKSEITKEAKVVINTVFAGMLKSDDKEVWKKAISFADQKVQTLEATVRGTEMFIWRSVKFHLLSRFGRKFISK
jgi:hypothetical protein